ncbi:N-acetyltransferase [Desulfobulbus sp. AH-315-M07]|nr:N-acetyltransferase [Desulfobulbus sp. AH-315-M07]
MTNTFFAHPKALVEEGATIGPNTRIWAFAHVMAGAEIGESCNIGNYAFIESGVRLADNCTVKNGVQVYEGVVAEDGVFIGPNCIFTNDRYPRSFLKRPKEEWLEKTLLREGCTVGAGVTILCGNTLGKYAFIAAAALVTRDVPDYALVIGAPGRVVGWVCRCGRRIHFEDGKAQCEHCSKRYVATEVDDGLSVEEAT